MLLQQQSDSSNQWLHSLQMIAPRTSRKTHRRVFRECPPVNSYTKIPSAKGALLRTLLDVAFDLSEDAHQTLVRF